MDADGEVALPVEGGRHLKEDFVGSHFADYDFTVVILSHFKGHAMGGFGGADQEHVHRHRLVGGQGVDTLRRAGPGMRSEVWEQPA